MTLIETEQAALLPGDRAPPVIGITIKGQLFATDEQAGRACVMILAKTVDDPGVEAILAAFADKAETLAAGRVDLLGLIDLPVEQLFEYHLIHPSAVLLVGSLNGFLERIGFTGDVPEILVLDRNMRAAARFAVDEPEMAAGQATAIATGLPAEAECDALTPAPVLILPNLLERSLCQELIDRHLAGPSFESPALYIDNQGRTQQDLDNRMKKRRDYLIELADPLHARLTAIMRRRVFPEIRRAFQSEVAYTDRFNICCYPGDGGFFRRHRDDRPEIVSFRKFALSINLTTASEGYKGGFLRLPEFNDHHYRCPTGGGVLFSVALLHEIMPVVAGNRFVLVTHLHDEAGEAKRKALRAGMVERGMA